MFQSDDLSPHDLKHFDLGVDPFADAYDEDEPLQYEELGLITHYLCQAMLGHQMAVLVGEPGSGKSTALRLARDAAFSAAGGKLHVSSLDLTSAKGINPHTLEQVLLLDLKGKPPTDPLTRSRDLKNLLLERRATSRTVLVIDDAHQLRPEVLTCLRTLREFGTPYRLLAVILIGEPLLASTLAQPQLSSVLGRSRVVWMPAMTADADTGRGNVRAMNRKPDRTGELLRHIFSRVGQEAAFDRIFADPAAVRRLGEMGRYPLAIRNAAVKALKVSRKVGSRVVTAEAVELVGKD